MPLRDRRGQVLFIDVHNLGTLVHRTRRELSEVDIQKTADTYHVWRSNAGAGLVPAQDKDNPVGAGLVPAQARGDHKGRPYHRKPQHLLYCYANGQIDESNLNYFCEMV